MKFENLKKFLLLQNIDFAENEPLKNHTTFKIGGGAKIFAEPKNSGELRALVDYLKANEINYFVIGRGSNILPSDDGFDGCIVKLAGDFEKIEFIDEVTIKAGAAANLIKLCKIALENSLTGLEFAYGIPGSVGGAVFMNAGAYGGEISDVLYSCNSLYAGNRDAEELDLGYRHSIFETQDDIITFATFRLGHGDKDEIQSKMQELLQKRKDKQPLEYPSAGSTFKRPEGFFAGALIEQSGLKGYRVGDAEVSVKHAGFVVNVGNATAQDVHDVIAHCKEVVKYNFNVDLEPEIRFI